jgi:hypothetical protein
MPHKPKTAEDVARKWAKWAKTPEQETRLSEAIDNALRSYKWARGNLENELAPSQAREDLERLSAALDRLKAALGCHQHAINSAVHALLRQKRLKLQHRVSDANKRTLGDANTRREAVQKLWDDANKEWGEIEKRFWKDIEAISRLYDLAASAVNENPAKIDGPYEQRMSLAQGRDQNLIGKQEKSANRNNSLPPWMVIFGSSAEFAWREVLGRVKRGKPFLKFYNDLCDLAGEEPVELEALKQRRKTWCAWEADCERQVLQGKFG